MAQGFKTTSAKALSAAAILSLGILGGASSARAGLFDQLFGAPQAAAPAPSYDYVPQSAPEPFVVQRHRPRPKRIVVDAAPTLQKPTDLMHDATLRPGDAVMMKGGIHVYDGHGSSSHKLSDFKPLDTAQRVKAGQRVALAAMDVTRNDPLTKAAPVDTIASGRSAAVATAVVEGVKFTDQRGRTIRYVGP